MSASVQQQQLHTPAVPAGGACMAAEQQAASTQELLPVFDLAALLSCSGQQQPTEELLQQCRALAACLEQSGCVVVRDPRVSAGDNDTFLDLMEAYFERSDADKAPDARPHLAYQVGVTPEGVEVPRCVADPDSCEKALQQLAPGHQPTLPTGADAKWRFFWRVGQRPPATSYPELNAEPVVPQGFPAWSTTMDAWGGKLLAAATGVAEMAALGWGLDADAFTSRMQGGPHLLAPTGSDLQKHGGLVGTVLAGFHYDLNFITIHGRSRFPGLYVWLRDGTRAAVTIPPGCLLCQAGKQLEWLTGGHVQAGMHEVIVTERTQAAAAAARAAGRSTWRVSSTLFSHIASDVVLQPLLTAAHQPAAAATKAAAGGGGSSSASLDAAAYPPTPAGQQVQQELEAIQLRKA